MPCFFFGLVATSLTLLSSASALGNFTVTAVLNGAPINGRQRVDLLAFNDGAGGTGTKLLDVNFHYGSPTTRAYFGVEDLLPLDTDGNSVPDGLFDSVNLYNVPSLQPQTSQLRFSNAPGATLPSNPTAMDHNYLGFTPSLEQNVAGTPYAAGLTSFTGEYGVLVPSIAPIANGTGGGAASGASFGRLYIDAGGSFTMSGKIVGDHGTAVSFTTGIGDVPPDPHFVVVTSPPPATITFGKDVSNGVNFYIRVSATDIETTDYLRLLVGKLPPGVNVFAVSPDATSPVDFTVAGTLDYSTNHTTVTIPFIVVNGFGGSYPGSIVLNVVPEPTSLLALATILGVVRHRRA